MFEENLGLSTATPCLESLGSASCSFIFFLLLFLLVCPFLSVLSCFLRQEPLRKQGRGAGETSGAGFLAAGDPAGLASSITNCWHLCTKEYVSNSTHLCQATLRPGQRRQTVTHIMTGGSLVTWDAGK